MSDAPERADKIARISDALVSLPGALAGVALMLLLLGWRGLGPRGVALIERARSAATTMTRPRAGGMTELLGEPGAGLNLLSGAWLRVVPGDHLVALWGLGVVGALASTALVWWIARKLTDRAGGLLACALFWSVPAVLGAATTPGHELLACALMLGTLALGTHEGPWRWRHAAALWLVGGLWLLAWPPMLLWACALLLMTLWTNRQPPAEDARGLIGTSWLPAGLLLAPVVVPIVATLLHPGLLRAPKAGWLRFLEGFARHVPPAPVGPTHKLPLWLGFADLAWSLPLTLLVLATGGALWLARHRRGARAATLIASPLVFAIAAGVQGMPWIGAIDTLVMQAAALAILAAAGLRALLLHLLPEQPTTRQRVALIAMCATLLAPGALNTASLYPYTGAYHSALSGGLSASAHHALPPYRDGVLPRATLRALPSSAPLRPSALDPTLDLMRDARAPVPPRAASPTAPGAAQLRPLDGRAAPESPDARVFGPQGYPLFVYE